VVAAHETQIPGQHRGHLNFGWVFPNQWPVLPGWIVPYAVGASSLEKADFDRVTMRVLLVDDHALFRRGLRLMLQDLMPSADVSEADSCAAAVALSGTPFDLVMLDLNMPGVSGIHALESLKATFAESIVVVVSGEEDPALIRTVIARGAAGFIPKTAAPEVMQSALQLVLARGIYLPEQVMNAAPASLEGLTRRQLDVLRSALKGMPNKVIGRELGISEGTVKSHLSAAFQVLSVRNRTEALYRAAKIGLKL